MASLKDNVVELFSGERFVAISPIELYSRPGQKYSFREKSPRGMGLTALHGILSIEKELSHPQIGLIKVRVIDDPENDIFITRDESFWGGDGVLLAIPSNFSAREFSKAVGAGSVITSKTEKKYYIGGEEILNGVIAHVFTPSEPTPQK